VATLLLSLGGNYFQYSRAQRDKQLAQIEKEQLDLDTERLQKEKTKLTTEINDLRKSLADQYAQLASVTEKLAALHKAASSAETNRDTLLQALAGIQKSAAAAQDINQATAAGLSSSGFERLTTNVSKWDRAREEERQAFVALADGNFDAAVKAFQASEDAVNGYHLDDPAKRKEVLGIIVSQYSGGAPKDLIDRLKAQL